jgi:hypothetical protein
MIKDFLISSTIIYSSFIVLTNSSTMIPFIKGNNFEGNNNIVYSFIGFSFGHMGYIFGISKLFDVVNKTFDVVNKIKKNIDNKK